MHSLKQDYSSVYTTWNWEDIYMFFEKLDTPATFISLSVQIKFSMMTKLFISKRQLILWAVCLLEASMKRHDSCL